MVSARPYLSLASSVPAPVSPSAAASSAPLFVLLGPRHLRHPPLHLLLGVASWGGGGHTWGEGLSLGR